MTFVDPTSARDFLEAAVAAFSVLGGTMAYWSGYAAAAAQHRPAEVLSHQINLGIAEGFRWGSLGALMALIITAWN